jgi:FAD/FMN-containing dehydrogenase
VLTAVADTSVAGTLSVAGIGGTSHRFGAQVNNVIWMDVITPKGELVRCSASENRELFDCVRAGIGQFGVILRACFPVRRSGKFVTVITAVYDDPEQLFTEALDVIKRDLVDQIDGGLFPFEGKHELLVHYGIESEDESPDAARRLTDVIGTSRVRLMRTVPFWNDSGPTDHFFVAGLPERFAPPGTVRPFVDQAVSVELASRMFRHLRGSFSRLLEVAHIAILFGNAHFGNPAPLWRLPDADPIVGVGASPFIPELDRDAGAALMVSFGQYWQKRGAKRYVAGYLGFDTVAQWAEHFGELWPWFVQMKLKYDPARIMNTRMLPDGWAESVTTA